MDRRHFIGSLVAVGGLAAMQHAEASPIAKIADLASDSQAPKARMDDNFIVIISDLHTNPGSFQPEKFKKVRADILRMRPLPAQIIALGDLAYLTGKVSEYALLKELLAPLENAGIKLTLAMGNHDNRKNFADAFPEYAAKSVFKDRFTYIVQTTYADIIVLDSLQQSKDPSTWITPGALNDEQKEWLASTLAGYTKPVFVSAHHPINEVAIDDILHKSPTCCGYIYGHDHRWRLDWIHDGYSKRRLIRTLCMPSTGHWGDIGFVEMHLGKDNAVCKLHEKEFFFPEPASSPSDAPEQWALMAADIKDAVCTFDYI